MPRMRWWIASTDRMPYLSRQDRINPSDLHLVSFIDTIPLVFRRLSHTHFFTNYSNKLATTRSLILMLTTRGAIQGKREHIGEGCLSTSSKATSTENGQSFQTELSLISFLETETLPGTLFIVFHEIPRSPLFPVSQLWCVFWRLVVSSEHTPVHIGITF